MVLSATCHIEAAYAAAAKRSPHRDAVLKDLRITHPIVLADPEEVGPQAIPEVATDAGDYIISSRAADADPESVWLRSSRGRINILDSSPGLQAAEKLGGVRECLQRADSVDVTAFYASLERSGLRYGDAFRGVRFL
jgi:hypothetical protein